jgi:TPR repeat protein
MAAKWARIAAHQSDAASAATIGNLLIDGSHGVSSNREEGLFWLRKAARQKEERAVAKLKQLGESIEDPATEPSILDRLFKKRRPDAFDR